MPPEPYAFFEVDRVQCPRCGEMREISLAVNTGHALEYAGVCESAVGSDVRCGTVLRLLVVAHTFPH